MRSYRVAAVVCLAMAALFVSSVLADDLPELKFEKYTLPNGLDVILYEDHTVPMVTVNVYYHVGSQNEVRGKTGFAHLFEHMMFQGSEHHNVMFDEDIDVFGGVNNGGTNADGTRYWETMPSNYLKKSLWLEADRMGYLLPAMTQERLDNQISVVVNEKRQNYDEAPYGQVRPLLHEMLYPPEHPYNWITIGHTEDLEAATMEDVTSFFKTWYAPNNASLCIAGDFDPAEAKQWVEEYFGPIPSGPKVKRNLVWMPVLTSEKRASYEDNVELARLHMVWHTPPYYAPGDAEFDLLASILTGGKTSRLYKSLVYDKQIAQDVASYQSSREIGSHFQIQATAKPGVSLEELEQEIDNILNDILTNGVTPAEFELARTNWESGFIRGLDNISGFGGMADKLNAYNLFLGEPDMFNWDKGRYEKATIENMLNYMKTYMQPEKRAILSVYPKGQPTASELTVDMAINPAGAEKPSFTPPTIQTATLSNGMELYLVEDHDLPLIQCDLLIKSGYDCDPSDRPGTASLTAELLNEGTKTRNALEISDAFRALGANFGVGSGWDNTFANLNVLKKNFDVGLDLVADILVNPTFPQEELDRQKEIYLGRIKQEAMQPFTICYKAYARELYGAGHPYGQPYTGSGTEESITAISRSDLQDYYKTYYRPNNSAVIVVGDITLDEAKSKLEKAYKDWKKGDIPESSVKHVTPLDQTKVVIIDKPGATQSVIFAGNLIEGRNDPEFESSTVVSNILGGGSTGRLYTNLRQDKGYTYGAYSFLSVRKGQGAFSCYSQVQGDKTIESLIEFMKEIRGIRGEIPITEKELTDSRNNYANGYPRGFQTIGGVAGRLSTLVSYDLPLDSWSTYIGKINSVDMNKANELAAKKIHPDALLIVVVGDRATIEEGIRGLNLGEVIIASAN